MSEWKGVWVHPAPRKDGSMSARMSTEQINAGPTTLFFPTTVILKLWQFLLYWCLVSFFKLALAPRAGRVSGSSPWAPESSAALRPSAPRTPPSALHSVRSLFPRQLRPTEGGGEGGVALRGGRDGAGRLRAGSSRCGALEAWCRCARPPRPLPAHAPATPTAYPRALGGTCTCRRGRPEVPPGQPSAKGTPSELQGQ